MLAVLSGTLAAILQQAPSTCKFCASSIGGNTGKETEEAHAYNTALNITSGITVFELQTKFADLNDIRTNLLGGPREVSDERFCADVCDMVKRRLHCRPTVKRAGFPGGGSSLSTPSRLGVIS